MGHWMSKDENSGVDIAVNHSRRGTMHQNKRHRPTGDDRDGMIVDGNTMITASTTTTSHSMHSSGGGINSLNMGHSLSGNRRSIIFPTCPHGNRSTMSSSSDTYGKRDCWSSAAMVEERTRKTAAFPAVPRAGHPLFVREDSNAEDTNQEPECWFLLPGTTTFPGSSRIHSFGSNNVCVVIESTKPVSGNTCASANKHNFGATRRPASTRSNNTNKRSFGDISKPSQSSSTATMAPSWLVNLARVCGFHHRQQGQQIVAAPSSSRAGRSSSPRHQQPSRDDSDEDNKNVALDFGLPSSVMFMSQQRQDQRLQNNEKGHEQHEHKPTKAIPFKSRANASFAIDDPSTITNTAASPSSLGDHDPAVAAFATSFDEEEARRQELKQFYDMRTWDMYLRITEARQLRQRQLEQERLERMQPHMIPHAQPYRAYRSEATVHSDNAGATSSADQQKHDYGYFVSDTTPVVAAQSVYESTMLTSATNPSRIREQYQQDQLDQDEMIFDLE